MLRVNERPPTPSSRSKATLLLSINNDTLRSALNLSIGVQTGPPIGVE